MIKWSILVVILASSSAYAASLYGSANINTPNGALSNGRASGAVRGPGGEVNADFKLKQFKGTLYLFAPQSWIDTFNAIPEAGQTCMMSAFSDPTNTAIASSNDVDQAKQLVQSKCPENSAQINSFFDATQSTMKSLPEDFLNNLKSFGDQVKQLGDSFKQQATSEAASGVAQAAPAISSGAAAANVGSEQFKQKITQFSKIMATFLQQLSSMSQESRQQIATAFPKLSPFVVGANADTLLKELTELYTTLSSGQFDPAALRIEGQQLKTALDSVWNEYKAGNTDGIQQASQLFGKDLNNALQSGQFFQGGMNGGFNAEANVGANGVGASANNNFRANFEQKKNELRERMQNAWASAKATGQAGIEKAKEAGQTAFHRFNDDQNAQSNGSLEKDGVSADVEAH